MLLSTSLVSKYSAILLRSIDDEDADLNKQTVNRLMMRKPTYMNEW